MTEYQTKTIYKDRYVQIDDSFTAPVELIKLPPGFRIMLPGEQAIATGTAYSLQYTRAQQCNGKLAEIAGLKTDQP